MSARVNVLTAAASTPPLSVSAPTGRAFVVGDTQRGPDGVPVLIRSLAEYREIFGGRTGGADVYDALRVFFAEGGTEAYVARAIGPAAAKATRSLDGGKLVVTAKEYGAFANTWTAEYVAATKTLVIVTDAGTETYTGTDAATLVAAAEASKTVEVTSSGSLPGSDVAAAALAGGKSDAASTDWDTAFIFPADLGVGAVFTPGFGPGDNGDEMATHAAEHNRIALIPSYGTGGTDAVSDITVHRDTAVLVWPHVVTQDGTTVVGTAFAAAVRARAHAAGGPGQSPIAPDLGMSVSGLTPAVASTDAVWAAAHAAGVSVIRTVAGRTRLYGWQTLEAFGDQANLRGAQHRDLVNAITAAAAEVGDNYVGRRIDGRGRALASFAADLEGLLATYAASDNLFARRDPVSGDEIDPGYVVDVGGDLNPPSELAAGRLRAAISVRLSPTAEFVTITITAGDAGTTF